MATGWTIALDLALSAAVAITGVSADYTGTTGPGLGFN